MGIIFAFCLCILYTINLQGESSLRYMGPHFQKSLEQVERIHEHTLRTIEYYFKDLYQNPEFNTKIRQQFYKPPTQVNIERFTPFLEYSDRARIDLILSEASDTFYRQVTHPLSFPFGLGEYIRLSFLIILIKEKCLNALDNREIFDSLRTHEIIDLYLREFWVTSLKQYLKNLEQEEQKRNLNTIEQYYKNPYI